MNAVLQTKNLEKRFGAVAAARDINITIEAGEIVGVIGANGAGKTTFINMVTGYMAPSSGTILLEGRDITGMASRKIIRLGVARSFQASQTFETMTVLDNLLIAAGLCEDRGVKMLRTLHRAALIEQCQVLLDRYGIAGRAADVVGAIPQGVRKVLDIAMAMVGSPRLVLLDEPTSGVSTEERFPIMDRVFGALREDRATVLLVEHDMEIIQRYASRVLAFYDGAVISDGPPAQVLRDPAVLQYVLGDQPAETEARVAEGEGNAICESGL